MLANACKTTTPAEPSSACGLQKLGFRSTAADADAAASELETVTPPVQCTSNTGSRPASRKRKTEV